MCTPISRSTRTLATDREEDSLQLSIRYESALCVPYFAFFSIEFCVAHNENLCSVQQRVSRPRRMSSAFDFDCGAGAEWQSVTRRRFTLYFFSESIKRNTIFFLSLGRNEPVIYNSPVALYANAIKNAAEEFLRELAFYFFPSHNYSRRRETKIALIVCASPRMRRFSRITDLPPKHRAYYRSR